MVFSTSIFLFVFLPLTLAGYFLIRQNLRNVFLLILSLLFYAWGEPKFVWIMILSIVINYVFGLLIHHTKQKKKTVLIRLALACGVFANISMLFYFKYSNFFLDTLNSLTQAGFQLKNIILPIGISFFTFQGMSYILDLYMGTVSVQKNPLNVALYISLFPQLIAGPIVRYKDVNEQIDSRTCSVEKFALGVRRFIIGLAKKVVIANQLAYVADLIFDAPAIQHTPAIAWLGAICYSMQIYFDFSGYSDMAIGLGKMFGFDFLENFDYPYISKSITEFWRRWHISLSSWFRDYVYIPLGGNRKGVFRTYRNLGIVFLLTGLWHGASWNFIFWGVWHGFFIIFEKLSKTLPLKPLKKQCNILHCSNPIHWVATMFIVLVGWVFFRAADLQYALQYLGVMFGLVPTIPSGFKLTWYLTANISLVLLISVIACVPWFRVKDGLLLQFSKTKIGDFLQTIGIVILLAYAIIMVVTSTYNPFIYFRF